MHPADVAWSAALQHATIEGLAYPTPINEHGYTSSAIYHIIPAVHKVSTSRGPMLMTRTE